jgi:EAL domain-containing protein (putative c-di-GMP-specific phosphodiesterase class I)
LYYQPLVNLKTGKIIGVEALSRWQPEGQKPISPVKFIPIADQSGLIIPLTEWALRTACQQHSTWIKEGLPPLIIAVNVTSLQFKQANFQERILRIIEESGMDSHYFKLEITEDLLLQNIDHAIGIMRNLKEQGIRFAIDDFGTGYSSLSYLTKLPVDQLKIDQSFVRGIQTSQESREIIKAIISIAKTLQLSVIAEGVEVQEQLDFLRNQGCDEIQGYFYSKPISIKDFRPWVNKNLGSLPSS